MLVWRRVKSIFCQVGESGDRRETEQYSNPVYSSDLRDHIHRRDSVVEVSR